MDLVERYLQSVRFWLPKSQGQDISAELAEDIRSQVEDQERKLGRSLSEDELASLLKQRGSPFFVAEKYQPQRSLIGPGLFHIYVFVLRLVGLFVFIPWLAVWLGLVIFAPAFRAAYPGWSLLGTLGTFVTPAFYLLGIITLNFAVAEQVHRRVKVRGDWNPRRLPAVREKRKISRFSSLTTAVFGIMFLFWWLGGLKFPVIMLEDKKPWTWTAGPVWQGFHQQMFWPVALLALATAGLAAYNLFHPSWSRLWTGVRSALNGVGAALLFLGIGGYSSEVQAQLLRMTSAHPGVPTIEAVRIWTDIIVFLSLLFAGIICLLTCLWLLWRVIRWKTLFPAIGRGLATLAVISLMALGAFGAQTPAAVQTGASSTPSDQEIRRLLIERIDVQHRSVGMVVGLITPAGRRVISYGRFDQDDPRPLNGSTVFEIGSVTKVFTSLLLADMVNRGEVALADPVAKYLPAGVKIPEWKGRQITLVDLATQTSGLPFFPTDFPLIDDPTAGAKEFAAYPVEKLYQFLSGYELLHDIGVNWEYSNLGVGLLGFALARQAGTDYENLVRARITGPLGMKSTSVALTPGLKKRLAAGHDGKLKPAPEMDFPEFLAGAGSLHSSTDDLLTFLDAFLGYSTTPLAPAMKAMLKTERPGADWLAFLGGKQALGWWVIGKDNDVLMAHAGETNGYSSSLAYDPRTRVGAVVLSNCVTGGDDMAMHVVRPSYPLSKPDGELKKRREIAVDLKLFDLYAGKYQVAPNAIIVISREGDKLAFMAPSSPRVRLHPETERDYFIATSDVQVTFQVDGQGRTTGLTLHLYSQFDIPAKKVEPDSKNK